MEEPMKNVIAGAAGHIDHGKTALVKALTGIDADRLAEEKRRGITIDLGFAHLLLNPDLRIGFVDVPGHERFIKNMLAGVGGIDLVLLVVAADEGVMPQTREHFEICRLLRIPRGVIALTKADLVDAGMLQLARMEVEEFVAGSFLEGAPIAPVSSVTGAGLPELRAALERVAASAPEKDAAGHFRLPIDRAFTMKGFGAVATGTLVSGAVEREQEVELHPGGRRLRVRGVQVHGEAVQRASAGQRTALNLSGVDAAELRRGQTLSAPGLFRPVEIVDCRLELLASAKPLKHRAPVHFHAGAAELEAEARLLDGAQTLRPGGVAWVRFVLRQPALLLPGDRFIIRSFSPVTTIGGGEVVDICGRRYRKGESAGERLAALAASDAARVATPAREAAYGVALDELIALTGLTAPRIAQAAKAASLVAFDQAQPWYVDRAWFQAAAARAVAAVSAFHQANPLAPGMAKEDLRSREFPDAPAFVLDALLASADGLAVEAGAVRLRSHTVSLQREEEQARAAIEAAFSAAGLAVPSLAEALNASGVEPARARSLLALLLREKRLVRVGGELIFHVSALERLRQLLAARRGVRFTVAEFKEWTGISRKYAIPLLEYLDRERVTRREGDSRVAL
jgi:selenocysteine-specific elongation factor